MTKILLKTFFKQKLSLLAFIVSFFIANYSFAQSDYITNGSAYATGTNSWVLTQNYGSQGGSVWYQNYLSLNYNFDFTFQVYLGNNDGGADGIAFVLQPNSTGAGSSGGGLGYQGITPSLAVEYDTYQNSDPYYDHVALQPNGNVDTNYGSLGYASAMANGGNIEDGNWHTTRIVWDATAKNFKVYFDGSLRLNYTGDIVRNIFNYNDKVYWGFTGATGGASNLQQFKVVSSTFEVAPLTISAMAQSNCSGTTGNISVTGIGGFAPLTYAINNGGFQSGTTFQGLDAGTHTVTVKDVKGTQQSTTVTIGGFEPLQLTATVQNATGSGQCNGSVILTPSGGTGPYIANEFEESFAGSSLNTNKFTFINGSFSQNGSLKGLSTGGYTYWNNGIVTNQSFNRTTGKSFEGSFRATANGSYNPGIAMVGWAKPDAGNGYFDYSQLAHAIYFNAGALYIYESGNYMGNYNVPASLDGWYDFKITLTANGAAYYVKPQESANWQYLTTTNSYSAPATLKLGLSYYNSSNYYGNIETDSWKIGGNPATTNLCAGTYTYSITDANGCTASTTVTIKDYVPVTASFTKTDATCFEANDGTITITAAQGTAPYSYSINNGADFQESGAFSGLAAGTYQVAVKDATGTITQVQDAVIAQPQQVVVAVAASGATTFCPGGSVTLKASGADTYTWSNGATGASITVNQTGTYTVTGFVNGCASESIATVVTVEDVTAPIALTKNITVQLNATGNASITADQVNNGSSDACGIASIVASKTAFDCSNVGANTVTLTVTDNNGNVSTATAIVTVEDNLAPVAKAKNISVTLLNGQVTITPEMVDSGSTDACSIASLVISKSSFDCSNIGGNTVTLTVTDKNGNVSLATATVNVIGVIPAPSITVKPSSNVNTGASVNTIFLGYGAQSITLSATNPTTAAYSWTPVAGLSTTTGASPVFTPTAAGNYFFTVTATNEFGCSETATTVITVIDARCGNKNDKVLVCHKGQVICIAPSAVAAHLAHGCSIGGCNTNATQSITGTSVSAEAQELVAFPNPFSNQTNIEFTMKKSGRYRLELYDMRGALISVIAKGTGEENSYHSFDVTGKKLSVGMYLVRLTTPDGVSNVRVIRN